MGGAPGEGEARIDTWFPETRTEVFLGDTPGSHSRIERVIHRAEGRGGGRRPGALRAPRNARKPGNARAGRGARYNSHGAIGAVLCPGDYYKTTH